MTTRSLGNQGMRTPPVGFGCMGLSQGYGPVAAEQARETVRAAYAHGIRLFDTAMSYGAGENEVLVGDALRDLGPRDSYQLATKFGIRRQGDVVGLDGDPRQVSAWCDASLRRLGTDYVDLYYLHRVDPRYPLAETIGAMGELVSAGKVRYLGVSEVTSEQLRTAHAVHPLTAVQTEWSLMWRQPESDVIPAARELGIGIVAYSPLGRGLLPRQLSAEQVPASPFRASDARFSGSALAANQAQIDALARLADGWGMTCAQLALAWLLAQGTDVVPIPGTRSPRRAVENALTMGLALSAEQLTEIDAAAPAAGWAGDRSSFAVPVTRR